MLYLLQHSSQGFYYCEIIHIKMVLMLDCGTCFEKRIYIYMLFFLMVVILLCVKRGAKNLPWFLLIFSKKKGWYVVKLLYSAFLLQIVQKIYFYLFLFVILKITHNYQDFNKTDSDCVKRVSRKKQSFPEILIFGEKTDQVDRNIILMKSTSFFASTFLYIYCLKTWHFTLR